MANNNKMKTQEDYYQALLDKIDTREQYIELLVTCIDLDFSDMVTEEKMAVKEFAINWQKFFTDNE